MNNLVSFALRRPISLLMAIVATALMGFLASLFTVERIDTIRVFCNVPENDVSHLHLGDPAIVKPYGFEGKPFVGNVTRFSLRLNPETRNMRTEIDLPNPEEHLYPGMYAEVYRSLHAFREEFPVRLRTAGPRVLKQNRGNGGQGVWKVEQTDVSPGGAPLVRVLHAKSMSVRSSPSPIKRLLKLPVLLQRV